MTTAKKTVKKPETTELKTEGPLKEKDQQNQAIVEQHKFAEIALEKWHRLKEKVERTFKK